MISTSPQYTNLVSRLVIVLACLSLAACTKHVMIFKPIDVSRKDQVATAQFSVKSTGGYMFALNFKRAGTLEKNRQLDKIWGDIHNDGVPIHLRLRLYRDNVLVHSQSIESVGTRWFMSYEYEGRTLNAAVRLIRTMVLKPGDYHVEVQTLENSKRLEGLETHVSFSYYNPQP